MQIKIFKHNGKYIFAANNFMSFTHPELCRSSYESLWDACNGLNKLLSNRSVHSAIVRTGIEDLTKPIMSDETAEERFISHYLYMLGELTRRLSTINEEELSDEERQIEYYMVKFNIDDLKNILGHIDKEYKNEIEDILKDFKRLASKYFPDFAREDEKKEFGKDNADFVQQSVVDNTEEMGIPGQPTPLQQSASRNKQNAGKDPYRRLLVKCMDNSICLTEDEQREILEHCACAICDAIKCYHDNVIASINCEYNCIDIIEQPQETTILRISFNDKFIVNSISSCNYLGEQYPSYHPVFYQRYWKPIVNEIGAFCVEPQGVIVVPRYYDKSSLPDTPLTDMVVGILGLCEADNNISEIPLSFSEKTWGFGDHKKLKTSSKINGKSIILSQSVIRVRCIDKTLSLYDKIGVVIQEIDNPEFTENEYDINFGRKIVRLTESQIETV